MKKTVLMLLALGLVSGSFAQNLAAELDSVLQAYQKVQHFNGTVLVAKNGQVLLEKGYGYKNFATGTLNDTQTVFMIASVTKQFTSAVVLKLVEQHKLGLTDPLSKFFPAYPGGSKITIYNLLTHTAGIPDYTQDTIFIASHDQDFPEAKAVHDQIQAKLMSVGLKSSGLRDAYETLIGKSF